MLKIKVNLVTVFFILSIVFACKPQQEMLPAVPNQSGGINKQIATLTFGSCNRQNRPQVMWEYVLMQNPDLWIWLGDNIYGDTENMDLMQKKYNQVKTNIYYQRLLKTCPVIGIWDDHDYGVNDGGKEYPKKEESKKLLLDFLDVAPNHPSRNRPGAYQAYSFGPKRKSIKVILLDARYFRDELEADPSGQKRYLPNTNGDILGAEQWSWLENELRNNDAQLTLIASGIQFIPQEQIYEKWDNFPAARKRFFDLLAQTNSKNTILLSGDRHIAEVSRIQWEGSVHPFYEITASGLTHTWSGPITEKEPNRYRVGDLIIKKNFGLMKINWDKKPLEVEVEIRGLKNELFLEQLITLQE